MSGTIAAVVLAAGKSSRMGHFKLLADVGGEPMLARVVRAALASQARPVIVVVGNEAAAVERALAGLDVRFVHNADYAAGMSTSVRAGIAAVPQDCAGVLVLLGDMPEVGGGDLDRLIAVAAPGRIVVPVHDGVRGNPVLWPRSAFARMQALTGDVGAKRLLRDLAADVVEVALGTSGILEDVDTPEALARLRARRGRLREPDTG